LIRFTRRRQPQASGGFPVYKPMRPHTFLLPLLALAASALAQPAATGGAGEMSQREVALDNLLSERRSVAELEKVVAEARQNGISEQSILEARFLYHVDHQEDEAIAAMLPEFLAQRERFKIADSSIFSVEEDWLAVIEYVQAISALKKGDKAAFKQHITEAFWLSPRQASAFAPHIERLRLEESMSSVKIDFNTRLVSLTGDKAVLLRSLIEGRKAMILHFWSPSNRESEASLPDFAIAAGALEKAGIAMVSVLPENSPKTLTDARAMITKVTGGLPGTWLIDGEGSPLARLLRVQMLPTFVLVSKDGGVLFNGEPDDDSLWQALAGLDPGIVRPRLQEAPGE
jgi:hypothetical protein